MPHVVFVPLTGFRVCEEEMRELDMNLPGLKQRAAAIAERPALGLLTLAGPTPESWTCSSHGTQAAEEGLVEQILSEQPDLVAVSALTASAIETYGFCERIRRAGVPVVLGGLHASVCSSFCCVWAAIRSSYHVSAWGQTWESVLHNENHKNDFHKNLGKEAPGDSFGMIWLPFCWTIIG